MIAHNGVTLAASGLQLLLLSHMAIVSCKITMIKAHELLLAHITTKLIAAIREASNVIGVVDELLVHLLIAQLLRLLLSLWLTHVLLLRILSIYLVPLGLTCLRFLVHKLVQIIEALYILLV